jgi:hypothetical protein
MRWRFWHERKGVVTCVTGMIYGEGGGFRNKTIGGMLRPGYLFAYEIPKDSFDRWIIDWHCMR